MGNIHLVTGHAGKAHVTAADHGSLNAAIFGEGQYVLNRGSKFATTIISNNSIRVADGDIVMQGRHIRLDEGTYVDLAVENGSQGMYRNDLIVARYTKDSFSGVEDCNLVVIKGTAKTENATDPEYTSGDIINDHVLISEMPLYRIPLDGLNVKTLVPLFEMRNSYGDAINNVESHIADTNNPHGVTADQVGATSMELLWVNASPSSEFAAQTIPMDLSKYEYIKIAFPWTDGALVMRTNGDNFIADRTNLTSTSNNACVIERYARTFKKTDDGIVVSDCKYTIYTTSTAKFSATETKNAGIKPHRIYGIKGVPV